MMEQKKWTVEVDGIVIDVTDHLTDPETFDGSDIWIVAEPYDDDFPYDEDISSYTPEFSSRPASDHVTLQHIVACEVWGEPVYSVEGRRWPEDYL